MGRRFKIGDVIEFPSEYGFAYAQFVRMIPCYGHFIQVFPGFHSERPAQLEEIVRLQPQFETIFPVGIAVSRGWVNFVQNLPLFNTWPETIVFKGGNVAYPSGIVNRWWLSTGDKSWEVGKLTAEQKKYPALIVMDEVFLVDRLWNNYKNEDFGFKQIPTSLKGTVPR